MNNKQQYQQKSLIRQKKSSANQVLQLGKVPPNARELEKEVIGAMLLGSVRAADLLEILDDDEMFYDPHCQIIAETARFLCSKGVLVDLPTIHLELDKNGRIGEVGGAYGLTQLTSSNLMYEAKALQYARIIKAKFFNRRLIAIGAELVERAYEDEDIGETIYNLNLELEKISQENNQKGLRHISEVLFDVYEDISKEMNQTVEFNGVPTGFSKLNSVTGGWQKTDLIIIAARPSVGKTAFALNLAYAASKTVPTAIFNLEMADVQLARRLVSISTQIPLDEVSRPYIIRDKDVKMQRIAGDVNLQERNLFINDTPGLKVSELKAHAIRLKKKYGLGLIIIDYLQLMEGEKENGNREQEIAKISRGLKKLAKELEVPIIALSQLSRAIETRSGGAAVPQLSDLRESGAIEQDADMVAFIYKPIPSEITAMPEMKDMIHFLIAKHRNGKLADLLFVKNLTIQTFSESKDILNAGNLHQGGSFVPIDEPYDHKAGLPAFEGEGDLPF